MYPDVHHINFSQSGSLYIIVNFFQWIQAVCNEVEIFTIAASENGSWLRFFNQILIKHSVKICAQMAPIPGT